MSIRTFASSIGSSVRRMLGPIAYHQIRELVDPSARFDEVGLIRRAIGRVRKDCGVMLDVGTHKGESAEQFAAYGWVVHCFEPNPGCWEAIESRVLERFPAARLFPVAVGEHKVQQRLLYSSPVSTGITSLYAFHDSHKPSVEVEVVTLEAHCREEGLSHVDFLKIDAEGADLDVLRGFNWEEVYVDVVLCEFEDQKTVPLGYRYGDMAEFLRARGFRVIVSEWSPITRYGESHTWVGFRDYPCALSHPKAWGNLVAFRGSPVGERVLRELRRREKSIPLTPAKQNRGGSV